MTKIIRLPLSIPFPLPLSVPYPSGFRCEAARPAVDGRHYNPEACEAAGDPATLIGLALSFARQGPLFDGAVPALIRERLNTHASHGNPACRMALDWIDRPRKVQAEAAAANPRACRAQAEMISAKTVKANEEMSHG